MTSLKTPVLIATGDQAAPLSAQQKKFNRHIERIAQQRALLADWQLAITSYKQRYAQEAVPLQAQWLAVSLEILDFLDACSSEKKLTKPERRILSEAIAGRALIVIDATNEQAVCDRVKEIYNRHSGGDYDAEQAQAQEMNKEAVKMMARDMVRDVAGDEIDLDDAQSPQEVMDRLNAHMQAHMQAQEAENDQQRQAHQARRPRKPSAREIKAQEQAAQATQSVREVYRKLASSLHPDRETDPDERARKTALMQRVNQAYAENKLLDLLQLQLEIEQIDPEHIVGLSEEVLKHYNRVLAEQLQELQQEVEAVKYPFCIEFRINPFEVKKPVTVQRDLAQRLRKTQTLVQHLRRDLNALRADPQAIKMWIKQERLVQKMADFMGDW